MPGLSNKVYHRMHMPLCIQSLHMFPSQFHRNTRPLQMKSSAWQKHACTDTTTHCTTHLSHTMKAVGLLGRPKTLYFQGAIQKNLYIGRNMVDPTRLRVDVSFINLKSALVLSGEMQSRCMGFKTARTSEEGKHWTHSRGPDTPPGPGSPWSLHPCNRHRLMLSHHSLCIAILHTIRCL